MADVHLPPTLPPLFPGLPRQLDLEAATVVEAIDRLDERWPGLRDRLCEGNPAHPSLRPHINVFVDRERAARAILSMRTHAQFQRRSPRWIGIRNFSGSELTSASRHSFGWPKPMMFSASNAT